MVAAVVLLATAAPAPAFPGSPPFEPGVEYAGDFPDPHVIFVGGTYLAYGTNTGGVDLPMVWSTDLDTWFTHGSWGASVADDSPHRNDALVRLPAWAAKPAGGPEVWAPAVVEIPGAGWRAYYGVQVTTGSRPRFCLSVATAPGPTGPFVDATEEPLTCGYGPLGVLDPWVHLDDDGTAWLVWNMLEFDPVELDDDDPHFPLPADAKRSKGDPPRVLPGSPSGIWSQPLDDTGLGFAEDAFATRLLTARPGVWEAGIIENPSMFEAQGGLHLFYSANVWATVDYATGWARCATPAGPCTRVGTVPVHRSGPTGLGPGGGSVFRGLDGELKMAYHTWDPPYVGYPPFPVCDTDGDGVCGDRGRRLLRVIVVCELPAGGLSVGVPDRWAFCDTPADSWMGPGVGWLAEHGITTGVSEHRFLPDRAITRAEAVTLVWRWAGRPGAGPAAPFTDLRPGAFYEEAVRWAADTGVVRGTTPVTFDPEAPITRAQLATILHRAAGGPDAAATHSFADVDDTRYYGPAVAWLAEAGITTGVSRTRFAPDERASRAAVATMLCRHSRVDAGPDPLVVAAVPSCPG